MRRRIRRKRLVLFKWITAIALILLGIPLLFIYGVRIPWKARHVPMINLWDVETSRLLTMTLDEYVKGSWLPRCLPIFTWKPSRPRRW